MSTGRSEDEAWRSIVDNYGERARLEAETSSEPDIGPDGGADGLGGGAEPAADTAEPEAVDPEERFVPPVPPPAPPQPLARRAAWAAVLGSPVVLVLALLLSLDLPGWLGYALVAGFVGGFGHLVWTMQRADERDPWDDGAQI